MELLTADVVPIWLAVPRREIGYVKFLFESYEGVAVLRTWDRRAAILVVLAAPDFLDDARRIIEALAEEIDCRVIEPPVPGMVDLLGPEPPDDSSEDDAR